LDINKTTSYSITKRGKRRKTRYSFDKSTYQERHTTKNFKIAESCLIMRIDIFEINDFGNFQVILVMRNTVLRNIVLAFWRISSGIRRKRGKEEIQDNLLIRADIKTLIPRECGICYSPGA
jgi:hypothetical protein